jgi:ubiquitin carboxyl-terminal hydrolase 36/42
VQVLCMVCKHASNRYESMLDLCLHITDSNITSIDSALSSFVEPEWLDGDNKYQCDRCDAKVRARRVSTHPPFHRSTQRVLLLNIRLTARSSGSA